MIQVWSWAKKNHNTTTIFLFVFGKNYLKNYRQPQTEHSKKKNKIFLKYLIQMNIRTHTHIYMWFKNIKIYTEEEKTSQKIRNWNSNEVFSSDF